jgi:hypothetical protein
MLSAELPSTAHSGGKKLIAYFIEAARVYERVFVAGPVWNITDNLIPGDAQYLRYAFAGSRSGRFAFTLADLEKFDAGDQVTELLIAKTLDSLLREK